MSHARQKLITRMRLIAAGFGAAVLLAGCSAGQITQTDTQVAAINGANGAVGSIDVRDAQLAYPASGKQYYSRGDAVRLTVTIVNSGGSADQLVGVTSTVTGQAQFQGTTTVQPGTAVSTDRNYDNAPAPTSAITSTSQVSGTSSTASSTTVTITGSTTAGSSASKPTSTSTSAGTTASTSTSPLPLGVLRITMPNLTVDRLTSGQTIAVTFIFAKAGQVTLQVPIAAPPASTQG